MIDYSRSTILFGLTFVDYTPAEHYIQKAGSKVRLIIDNSKNQADEYRGIAVKRQNALQEYVHDTEIQIVITTFKHHREITKSLIDMGFRDENILVALLDEEFLASYSAQYYQSKYGTLEPVPTRANLELSRNCNCRCIYCPMFGVDPAIVSETGYMTWDVLKSIVIQIERFPSIKTGYFCGKGETYLHPEWLEMMNYVISESNINHIIIYSNGMLLNEATVHKLGKLKVDSLWLEVSIDGESPQENNRYRKGSNYDTIKAQINYARQFFQGKNVTLQVLNTHPVSEEYLAAHNDHISTELPVPAFLQKDFPDLHKGSRVTVMFGSAEQYADKEITLTRKRVSRYNVPYPCTNAFDDITFDFKGNLMACSCDMSSFNQPLANASNELAFRQWQSGRQMKELRSSFLSGEIPEACTKCTQAPVSTIDVSVL